ncbi:MAG: hypothetical protein AAF681_05180, partial [Pseudomonadota bacterium]
LQPLPSSLELRRRNDRQGHLSPKRKSTNQKSFSPSAKEGSDVLLNACRAQRGANGFQISIAPFARGTEYIRFCPFSADKEFNDALNFMQVS